MANVNHRVVRSTKRPLICRTSRRRSETERPTAGLSLKTDREWTLRVERGWSRNSPRMTGSSWHTRSWNPSRRGFAPPRRLHRRSARGFPQRSRRPFTARISCRLMTTVSSCSREPFQLLSIFTTTGEETPAECEFCWAVLLVRHRLVDLQGSQSQQR